jgi:hypothetical protein
MELFLGLKGIMHRSSMRRMSENEIRKIAHDSMDQVRSVGWNAKGRLIL